MKAAAAATATKTIMLAANMKPNKRSKNPRRRRTLGSLFGAVMSMCFLPRTHCELFLVLGHSPETCSPGVTLSYTPKPSPLYGTKRTNSRQSVVRQALAC